MSYCYEDYPMYDYWNDDNASRADCDSSYAKWEGCHDAYDEDRMFHLYMDEYLNKEEQSVIREGIEEYVYELYKNGEVDEDSPYTITGTDLSHLYQYDSIAEMAEDYDVIKPDMTIEEVREAITEKYGNIPMCFTSERISILELK